MTAPRMPQPGEHQQVPAGPPWQHGPQHAASQYDIGQPRYAPYAVSPPKSTKRTLGIWSLVLGLSGLLLPIFLNSIAAIVLGIMGLAKEQSKGMSIAGIATGVFCLFIWAPIAMILILTAGAALPFLLLYAPFFTA